MHRLFITVLWSIFWIVIIETNTYLLYDSLPQSLQRYLDYGLSTESKLMKGIGKTDDTTDFVKTLGWLDTSREEWYKDKQAKVTQPDHTLLAAYGMSFTINVAKRIPPNYPQFELRFVGGPDAPPNHSYAVWHLDRDLHEAEVVIWGILSSGVRGMKTTTNLNLSFEVPLPYTYPKFDVVDGKLQTHYPPIMTLPQFRETFYDKQKWAEYTAYLQREDTYYHPFLFKHNFLDYLTLGRFFRRSFAVRVKQNATDDLYNANTGFNLKSRELKALNLMVAQFAQQVRAKGRLPVIMLFSIQGYDNHLYNALSQTLNEENIPFINSFTIANPANPKDFIPDGHFTPDIDQQLAEELVALLKQY